MVRRNVVWVVALVSLVPLLAGCMGGEVGAGLSVLADERTAGPGTAVEVPVVVEATNSTVTVEFEVTDAAGLDVVDAPSAEVGPDRSNVSWIRVRVPEDAEPGPRDVVVEATSESGSTEVGFRIVVEEPGERVAEGGGVSFEFTARFVNGTVIATNRPEVANSSIPKARFYRPPGRFVPLNVTLGPDSNLFEGLQEGLVGLGVGHSAALDVPPGKGFGNETIESELSRVEEIDRNRSETRVFEGARSQFRGLINDSSEVGDEVEVPLGPDRFPFVVTHLNETNASIEMNVSKGDRFTQIEAWPNGSVVTGMNETDVFFRVEPTVPSGETYTHYERWPDASSVTQVAEETVFVRHSPEVGTTWSRTVRRRSVQVEVLDVTDDTIVVGQDNPSPLAGMSAVFDVTVLDVFEPDSEGSGGGR